MSYKLGFCAQCGDKIMVANMHGFYTAMKPNYMQIDLKYGRGTLVRVHVCKGCAEAPNTPDLKKIGDELTGEGSETFDSNMIDKVKAFGDPVGYSIPNVPTGLAYPMD